jgi:hypothetical protein
MVLTSCIFTVVQDVPGESKVGCEVEVLKVSSRRKKLCKGRKRLR